MEEGRGPVARMLVQHGKLKKGDFIVAGRGIRPRARHRRRPRQAHRGGRTVHARGDLRHQRGARRGRQVLRGQDLKEAEAAAERAPPDRSASATSPTREGHARQHLREALRGRTQGAAADRQGRRAGLARDAASTLAKIGSDEVVVAVKHSGGRRRQRVRRHARRGVRRDHRRLQRRPRRPAARRRGRGATASTIRLYDVIYELTDDVTKAAEGLLEPELKLEVLGHAEVREVFKISKVGMIAGCYVTEGVIERNAQIRVTRGDIVIEKDRRLEQLKRFKDDAKEVPAGQECGMQIDGYDDIKVGDMLECYRTTEIARTL